MSDQSQLTERAPRQRPGSSALLGPLLVLAITGVIVIGGDVRSASDASTAVMAVARDAGFLLGVVAVFFLIAGFARGAFAAKVRREARDRGTEITAIGAKSFTFVDTAKALGLYSARSSHSILGILADRDHLDVVGGIGDWERMVRIPASAILGVEIVDVELKARRGRGLRVHIRIDGRDGCLDICITGGGLFGLFPTPMAKQQSLATGIRDLYGLDR